MTDVLTGLPNRAHFTDRVERAIERSKRQPDYRFAVLFLDIDRFKVINDSLGHLAGDRLLIDIAARLTGCLRAGDTISRPFRDATIARLGGDEFTILLDGIKDPGDPLRVADRIQRAMRAPFNLNGHEVFASASVGITLGGPELQPGRMSCSRDADTAMYRAKAPGEARCEVFDPAMRDSGRRPPRARDRAAPGHRARGIPPALPANRVAEDRPPDRIRGARPAGNTRAGG